MRGDRCACGEMRALSRTGYGTTPRTPRTVHTWAGCITYRDQAARSAAQDAIEDALRAVGASSERPAPSTPRTPPEAATDAHSSVPARQETT